MTLSPPFALLAAAVIVGCSAPLPGALGEQCELNHECDAPLVCRLARCRTECRTNRDCPIDGLCVVDSAGFGACLLADERDCVLTSDCPEPLVCRGEQCGNVCAASTDCPPGARCILGEAGGACSDPVEEPCTVASDCDGELVCASDRRCREECLEDRDCRQGTRCEAGVCARGSADGGAPSDGGRPGDGGADGSFDGSLADSGAGDAAPPMDARADSATLDGAADASPVDGASPDAATPDGAAADGAADAGCVDSTTCPSVVHGTVDCVAGACVITSCDASFDDCDGRYDTGCETSLATHREHCGACGASCPSTEACLASACVAATVDATVTENVHACALWSSGHVTCWGGNTLGELGNGGGGAGVFERVPVMVDGLFDAVAIASGANHVCALRSGGTVVCWGSSSAGELGDGGAFGRGMFIDTPTAVTGLSSVTQIAAGSTNSCAIHGAGAVSCWGSDASERLGDGPGATNSSTPVAVSGLTDAIAVDISGHACALRPTGQLVCWGENSEYQVGDGTTFDRNVPTAVVGLPPGTPEELVVTWGVTLLRMADGSVLTWGSNRSFAGGVPTLDSPLTVPTPLSLASMATAISERSVLGEDGRFYGWGLNIYGRIGGDTFDSPLSSPTPGLLTGLVEIAGASNFACVRPAAESVWCAGRNHRGQLGVGDTRDRKVFVPVAGMP